jgi:hypothetical protein
MALKLDYMAHKLDAEVVPSYSVLYYDIMDNKKLIAISRPAHMCSRNPRSITYAPSRQCQTPKQATQAEVLKMNLQRLIETKLSSDIFEHRALVFPVEADSNMSRL